MEKVYQIKKDSNELIKTFTDVVDYSEDFIIFTQYGNIGKLYADEGEYFSEQYIAEEVQDD